MLLYISWIFLSSPLEKWYRGPQISGRRHDKLTSLVAANERE